MKINLNFSGDKNSWFDLWHYHPNDIEYSNHSSTQRSESLKKLLDTFNHFKLKLQEYPWPNGSAPGISINKYKPK